VAASEVAEVVVVTGDARTREVAGALGARVVSQPDLVPGLEAAVGTGLAACAPGAPAAVLLGDLPALRPDDLDTTLRAVAAVLAADPGARQVVVPDADGTGTVLLAARRPDQVRHAFGTGSAARHVALGARRLESVPARLRRDVDTPADLAAAVVLGVGPRTARTLRRVQATVLRYDAASRGGEVVTDDGVRLPIEPGGLDGSGLLHLRPGQRVTCTRTGDGVTGVHVHGVGDVPGRPT
jgi:2-phospho-L-lactate guanylyltransferase